MSVRLRHGSSEAIGLAFLCWTVSNTNQESISSLRKATIMGGGVEEFALPPSLVYFPQSLSATSNAILHLVKNFPCSGSSNRFSLDQITSSSSLWQSLDLIDILYSKSHERSSYP